MLEYLSPTHWWGLLPGLSTPWPVYDWTHQLLDRVPGVAVRGYWHAQFTSDAHSCPTVCDPMDCSTPGFPVHHQLPDFTQTKVHWVSDAIQPSQPLLSPSPPIFNLSQHQGLFQWVSSLNQVAKVWHAQDQQIPCLWLCTISYFFISKKYKGTDSLKYFTILKYIEAWRPINYRFRRGMLVIQTRELGAVKNLIRDRFKSWR